MWKRSVPVAGPNSTADAKKKDPESCSIITSSSSNIVDTETGIPSSPFLGPYKDSQYKRRPGSVAHYLAITVGLLLLYLFLISSLPSRHAASSSPTATTTTVSTSDLPGWMAYFLPSPSAEDEDLCANEWRPEPLIGKCFGLFNDKVPEEASASWQACRAHCCAAKEACVTWQHQGKRGCFTGGPVRVGLEQASPSAWCEETAPATWKGRRLESRTTKTDGNEGGSSSTNAAATCTWSTEELPYQCMGLGPERKSEDSKLLEGPTKGRLSESECQQWCCDHEACVTWQWRADKGCFGGKEGHCEEDNEPYFGARKCVEGFC